MNGIEAFMKKKKKKKKKQYESKPEHALTITHVGIQQ
jgi:hypothetical protein